MGKSKITGIVSTFNGYNNSAEIEILIAKCDEFDLTTLVGREVEVIVK